LQHSLYFWGIICCQTNECSVVNQPIVAAALSALQPESAATFPLAAATQPQPAAAIALPAASKVSSATVTLWRQCHTVLCSAESILAGLNPA